MSPDDRDFSLKFLLALAVSPQPQMIGCPILRARCEGRDKQSERGRASGAEQWYPTLCKQREGWHPTTPVEMTKGRAIMAQGKGLRKECSELAPDNEILIAPDRTC